MTRHEIVHGLLMVAAFGLLTEILAFGGKPAGFAVISGLVITVFFGLGVALFQGHRT